MSTSTLPHGRETSTGSGPARRPRRTGRQDTRTAMLFIAPAALGFLVFLAWLGVFLRDPNVHRHYRLRVEVSSANVGVKELVLLTTNG